MNKLLQDGLKINKTVYLSDDRKKDHQYIPMIIQFVFILSAALCVVFGLKEGLGFRYNISEVIIAMILCTVVMYTLCQIPVFHILKLFFGIYIYGFIIYSLLPSLMNAFFIMENLIMDKISSYYGYNLMHFLADYNMEEKDTTIFVIVVMIPVVALITVAIVKSRFLFLCGLIFCLPMVSIFLFGMIPSESLLFAYIVVLLYMIKSGFSLHRVISKEQRNLIHRINSRAAFWISLFALLILIVLKGFINNENYNKVTTIKTAKSNLQTAMTNFSYADLVTSLQDFSLFGGSKSVGGLGGGKLGKTGKVVFTGDEQLEVTMPFDAMASTTSSIYLKGYVGSVYAGNKWAQNSAEDKKRYREIQSLMPKKNFQPLNQTNQWLQMIFGEQESGLGEKYKFDDGNYNIMQGDMKVVYKGANKNYIYAPYFTDFNKISQTYEETDAYTGPLALRDHYTFNYFFNFYMDDIGYNFFSNKVGDFQDYTKYENIYRNYVKSVYTKLPSKGVGRLVQEFSKPELKSDSMTISQKVNYVKDYLNKYTRYSLSPGALPKGKDYVEYFLYENKKGYCAHYASAATLMLRSMGVPARYVEGYVVKQDKAEYVKPNQSVTIHGTNYKEEWNEMSSRVKVTDREAHAWVEVYVDGCGWFPVEVTPSSNYTDISTLQRLSSLKDHMVKQQDKTPTPTPATVTPKPTKQATVTPNKPTNNQTNHKDQGGIKFDPKIVAMIIGFVLICGAISARVILKARKRNRLLNTKNRNKKALYLLSESEVILSFHQLIDDKRKSLEDCEEYLKEQAEYINPIEFSECMDIARKARFGPVDISIEELQKLEQFYKTLSNKIYARLPFYKKLYWKFILLM